MTAPSERRYEPSGLLAIDPRALFTLLAPAVERKVTTSGGVSVVDIKGPLAKDEDNGLGLDSYKDILCRVDSAIASSARTVVLRINSPGGDASGCMETARAISERCVARGKQLVAFVDGQACSAAYAIACMADHIAITPTSLVGSIGVLDVRSDVTAQDRALGMRFSFISSGSSKLDGNSHTAMTADEYARKLDLVTSAATAFFSMVSERRGVAPQKVQALEGGLLFGSQALNMGLADSVQSFDQLMSSLASGALLQRASAAGDVNMTAKAEDKKDTSYEDGIAALRRAAQGDDEMAKKARRMLAAEFGEDEEKKDGGDAKKAEGEEKKDEEKKDEPSASTSASTTSASASELALAAKLDEQGKELAKLRATQEATERAALLASRPDLDESLRTALASSPLSEVQRILGAMPKKAAPNPAASAGSLAATRGEGQVDPAVPGAPALSAQAAEMDARMGLQTYELGVRKTQHFMEFGVMPKQQAPAAGNGGSK